MPDLSRRAYLQAVRLGEFTPEDGVGVIVPHVLARAVSTLAGLAADVSGGIPTGKKFSAEIANAFAEAGRLVYIATRVAGFDLDDLVESQIITQENRRIQAPDRPADGAPTAEELL